MVIMAVDFETLKLLNPIYLVGYLREQVGTTTVNPETFKLLNPLHLMDYLSGQVETKTVTPETFKLLSPVHLMGHLSGQVETVSSKMGSLPTVLKIAALILLVAVGVFFLTKMIVDKVKANKEVEALYEVL